MTENYEESYNDNRNKKLSEINFKLGLESNSLKGQGPDKSF